MPLVPLLQPTEPPCEGRGSELQQSSEGMTGQDRERQETGGGAERAARGGVPAEQLRSYSTIGVNIHENHRSEMIK